MHTTPIRSCTRKMASVPHGQRISMGKQGDLFGDPGLPQPAPARAFGGASYEPSRDYERMNGQLRRVYEVMKDGHWHSLESLAREAGGTVASVSARVRDFRKRKYGSRLVERKHIKEGLFLYRMVKGGNQEI